MSSVGYCDELFSILELHDSATFVTKSGGLLAAIELVGKDPDGLDGEDFIGLSLIAQNIYGRLDRSIGISQYYAHFDEHKVSLRERDNVISNTLSQNRAEYLNAKNLSSSRIVHYFEILPDEDANKLNAFAILKHGLMSFHDKDSREILKNHFSFDAQLLIKKSEQDRLFDILNSAIEEVILRWKGLFSARRLSVQEMWAHMRFVANLDPDYLELGLKERVPEHDADIDLLAGDMSVINVLEMDVLKLAGPRNRYAKIAAVRRFSGARSKMTPAVWSATDSSPSRLSGNYLIVNRWQPLSEVRKDFMFFQKETELDRQKLNLFDALTGATDKSFEEKKSTTKKSIQVKIDELGKAESMPDVWGRGDAYIVCFDRNPERLKDMVQRVNSSASNARLNVVWESISLGKSYKALQPGNDRNSLRKLITTSSQFAASSLIYQSSIGQPYVPDLRDECMYILQSKDGQPFYYSPLIGGKALVIGVGRIRSGKTYLKNTLGTHFQKYGGIYRTIDVDPGSEPVAKLFDGGIFRVGENGSGFNVFESYIEPDPNQPDESQASTTRFKLHFMQLVRAFLSANTAVEYQSLTPEETRDVQSALDATLNMPRNMRSLSMWYGHLSQSLKLKFSLWVRKQPYDTSTTSGWYANLFDQDIDSIGGLSNPVGVYNLQALRKTKDILVPTQLEIMYRTTQEFEDPKNRHLPKVLDIDEAHYPISIPDFCEYIVNNVRTWGKWFASIQLWTQSPEELINTEGWNAIRGAATTFFFMADQNLDKEVYKEAFPFLTDGELDAISKLIPQREAYLIQPEIGVSKVVITEVDDVQHVINTSHPVEASIRDKLVAEHGFKRGVQLAVIEINKFRSTSTT